MIRHERRVYDVNVYMNRIYKTSKESGERESAVGRTKVNMG